jgi:hypothetical protein
VISLWAIELAVLWLLVESMLIVARAAAKVKARREASLESQTLAAA